MTDEQLEENIATIMNSICQHRNPALGPFINRVTLTLIPSKHYISIDVDKYVLKPTEEQLEDVCFSILVTLLFFYFSWRSERAERRRPKRSWKLKSMTRILYWL